MDGRGGSGSRGKSPSTDSQVIDLTSMEWTDEKHSMYLNSMEASFIDQLYSNESQSMDLVGQFLRTQKHPNSYGSNVKSPSYGQFKVQRRGCWEKLDFEKAKSQVDIEKESRLLSANQWIKHFRSPSIGKEEHHLSFNGMDVNELASQLIYLQSKRNERDTAVKKRLPACSHVYHQDSVGSNTEVSDQNFDDKEFEGEEKLNNTCSRKKARVSVTDMQFKDQVVPCRIPSGEPCSDENHACLKGTDATFEPDSLLLKD